MSEQIPEDCRRAISRWCRDDFYIYVRPITSCYLKPKEAHHIYWNVLVEYRNVEWQQWRAEGRSLAECIRELDRKIPRRTDLDPGYKPSGKDGRGGWLGPFAPAGPLKTNESVERIADREREKAKKKSKKSKDKKKSKKKVSK